jgi:hypothetical protein
MIKICRCRECLRVGDPKVGTLWAREWQEKVLCPDCGNKRCPKATDHNLACTKSNAPSQKGSYFENDLYDGLTLIRHKV